MTDTQHHTRDRMAVLLRADIAAHIRVGRPDHDICLLLDANYDAVATVRQQLGLRPKGVSGRPHSIEEAFWGSVRHEADGHTRWLGEMGPDNTPVLRHGPRHYDMRRCAYLIGHTHDPVGSVTAGCGEDWCVEPEHLADGVTRAYLHDVITALFGEPGP
ncbi:hypothetical protein [Streptomyces anandii]|uniref:hypothetical protein n=1 Tax=Streptomyces anandii TaxID=285454 RepID=UPI00379EA27A